MYDIIARYFRNIISGLQPNHNIQIITGWAAKKQTIGLIFLIKIYRNLGSIYN